MDAAAPTLQIGDWHADPLRNTLTKGADVVRLDARCMRLLVCLAAQAGQVVSVEKLLDEVWEGVVVSPDSVYQAIASLRRSLGDDPKNPSFIATVPRLGYRLLAKVSAVAEPPLEPTAVRRGLRPWKPHWTAWVIALVLTLAGLGAVIAYERNRAGMTATAVAVLPFDDLTSESMDEEYFADGMTEELIDRLSRLPGVRVPAATSSYALKGKKLPIQEIGAALSVGYVLDGSVRQAEHTLRISARLSRVEDGFVIWSQSYDRPAEDKVKIQEDIAREVAASLAAAVKR